MILSHIVAQILPLNQVTTNDKKAATLKVAWLLSNVLLKKYLLPNLEVDKVESMEDKIYHSVQFYNNSDFFLIFWLNLTIFFSTLLFLLFTFNRFWQYIYIYENN